MRSLGVLLAMLAAASPRLAWTAATGSPTAPAPPAKRAAIKGAARTKAAPARSDTEIEKDIRNRFAQSKIGAEHYQVHVQGGVATIEGKTNVIQHKGVATRLAKLGGATTVANRIEISEAAKQKAAKNLASGRRRAQIKRGDARSEPRSETATPQTTR